MDRQRDWLGRLAHDLAATRAELLGLLVLAGGGVVLTVLVVLRVDGATTADPAGAIAGADASPATGPTAVGGGGSVGAAVNDPSAVPGGPSPASTELVVHVTGAVLEPGVLTLPAGARLVDAVEAAGGTTGEAAPEVLNLAAEVVDGQRLHVPTVAEVEAAATADRSPGPEMAAPAPEGGGGAGLDPTTGRPPTAAPSGAATTAAGLLDLNLASTSELEGLPGVGPVLASRILDHREEQGRFTSVGQLRDVAGIGEKTFQALAPLVTVS